jgi:hypothetical protein
MDKHNDRNAARTTVAILAICVALLLTAAGFSATTVAEPLADYTQITRDATGGSVGDARGNELTAGPRDATGGSSGAATSDNWPTLVP